MKLTSGVVSITVTTGGSGYSSAPIVTFSGGSGAGASAVAQMAGTVVDAVVITNAGTGYTSAPNVEFSEGSADASAVVLSYGSTGQLCMFKGRGNDMYGVNGYSRGFRYDGDSQIIEPLGISRPLSAPVVSAGSGDSNGAVRSVAVINGGAGYAEPPTVTFSGGGLTDGDPGHASGRAKVNNAIVVGVTLDSRGSGYTSPPAITFSAGGGTGATLSVGAVGRLFSVEVTNGGAGYTESPTVSFASSNGLTGANVRLSIESGVVTNAAVLASGTGAVATGVSLVVSGGGGAGCVLTPNMAFTVQSVTAASTGAGFVTPPAIGFLPADGGAVAIASVANGGIGDITVLQQGVYEAPPTASINPVAAKAIAYTTQSASGAYKACMRYLDDTVTQRAGPIPSSISDFASVDLAGQASVLTWNWSNNGAESRVHKIELWRTTSDQQLVLYRVAILSKTDGVLPTTYSDTLSDDDLLDPSRPDFGIMPIVMANGQLNARRFEPPRITCSQACIFQDRAWYTCDTTGEKPNSIWHSEVDEPESAPEIYEIVLQENHGDSDEIVGLVPFGGALLILQKRHLYKLQYVSQPLIDASIALMAYRGALNARCVDVYDGVAFIADSYGLYAFDGNSQDTVSVPVDNYWREGIIDFSKSRRFHVRVSPSERVCRFYYCRSSDGEYPPRALCFCFATKVWWEETYANGITATVPVQSGGSSKLLTAGNGEFYRQDVGGVGSEASIPYSFRSGPYPLDAGPSRSVSLLYKPSDNSVGVGLHYNGSSSPRPYAVDESRGDGFVTARGSTLSVLDMSLDRSPLGDAPGEAKLLVSGRASDRSAGGDKHMAVVVAGAKTGPDPVVLYAVTVDGVTA